MVFTMQERRKTIGIAGSQSMSQDNLHHMNLTEQDLLNNLIATSDDSTQKVQALIQKNREKKRKEAEAQAAKEKE